MEAAAEETPALRVVTLDQAPREETLPPTLAPDHRVATLAPTTAPRVATPPQTEAILAAPLLIAARARIPTRALQDPTLKRAAAGTLRTPTAKILTIRPQPRATPTLEGQTLLSPVANPLPKRERMTIRTTTGKMMIIRTRRMVMKTMITPMTNTKMTTTRTTPKIPKTPRTTPARTTIIKRKTTTGTTTTSLQRPKRTSAEKIHAPLWRKPVMTRRKTIRHRTPLPRKRGTEQMPNYS